MSRAFWNSNLFYLLEGTGSQSEQVVRLRERMLERDDELCTSTLTLGEVLMKPVEQGDTALRQRYEDVLSRATRAFDRDATRRYAAIRLIRGIRPPDAIQLACAAQAGVDLFVTNDDRLSRFHGSGDSVPRVARSSVHLNWARHRVAGVECAQVFFNRPIVVAVDEQHSEGEPRFFKSETQERNFWAKADSARYVDWKRGRRMAIPNRKPSLRTISVRLPDLLLEELKLLANKRDVPYQSLLKVFLAERVEQELRGRRRKLARA